MSTTTTTNEETPVEVTNKYDNTQVKHSVDDELGRYFSKELGFSQSHVHTDVKLVLGYISCLIAAGSFYYEYKNGFNESIPITTACVIVYWFIQSVSFVYNFFVEKEEVFVGTKEKSTLKVSGTMEKYSPIYKLSFDYGGKTMRFEKNISAWFDENNTLVKDELDKDLKEMLDSMKAKVQ